MSGQEIIKEIKERAEEALQRKSVFSSSGKDVAELVRLIDELSAHQIDLELRLADMREREAALLANEKVLNEKLAAKDQFLSILAHDLKIPFHTLLGYSYLLMKEYPQYNAKKRISIIQILYENIKQTHELLENILMWSRAQTGKIQYHPRSINITTLIQGNIRLYQATAKAKQVSLEYISNFDELMIWADPELIQIVLRNLITNAIKFTPKSGHVTAGIHDIVNGEMVICVSDDGVGIAPELHQKLFNPDKGYSTFGTENEKGTGLGLVLCKEFIEKSGGRIWLTSQEGKGSSFYFTLKNKSGD